MKISQLTAQSIIDPLDYFPFLDASDTTQFVNGSTRKIKFSNIYPFTCLVQPTGSDDTATIQAALDYIHTQGGGIVVLKPGNTFSISSTLIIYSKTSLISYGATINLSVGNKTMLVDVQNNGGSAVDHITVRGGIWNIPNVIANGSFAMIRLGGSKLDVRDIEISASGNHAGFAMSIKNATDFTVENIFINNVVSDGFHIDGPCARGTVNNIYGIGYDDLVVVSSISRSQVGAIEGGDITDISINGIKVNGAYRANPVKILSGKISSTVYNINRINIKNLTGTCVSGFQSGVFIGDDTGFSGTFDGQINNITIENVSLSLPSGNTAPLFLLRGSSSSLVIPNIIIKNILMDGDTNALFQLEDAKVTNLNISDLMGSTIANSILGIVYDAGSSYTAITNLLLNKINFINNGSTGGNIIRTLLGNTFTNIYLNNIYTSKFGEIADTTTTSNYCLNNITMSNNTELFHCRIGGHITIQGANGIIATNKSSSFVGSGSIQSLSYNFPIDVGSSGLSKNTGDLAYNTNAARSCGVGPVGYNGAAWYNSLSGATL